MELLKELLETLKDTPSMAVWVLAIYFAYKALIVYAAYGFGRYVVGKVHDVITFKKVVEVEVEKLFVYQDGRKRFIDDDARDMFFELLKDIHILGNLNSGCERDFIYNSDIRKASKLIRAEIDKGKV
jgi:hypothetical protein